ncbi:PAS domain-containing sensor histidine kinase [Fulvivirgaceae bacterium BMA10]|uniref:histidine kinase n=1 Tax=Splendidivirga corallicola TaxID=3051826 RepID=A0ABT8KQM3_9BACT|nr:PAS domain-containing sensor histidine kinase [Fulvivirgaceae bacterium BMA10]
MKMLNQQHTALSNMRALYELSLSVGQSLDLKSNCRNFLKALMRIGNLSHGSIWLQKSMITRNDRMTGFTQFLAIPKKINHLKELVHLESTQLLFGDEKVIQINSIDQLTHHGDLPLTSCEYVLFRLDNIGFVVLQISDHLDCLDLKELLPVFKKFKCSIEGCMAHNNLKYEIAERKKKEKQIKNIALFPEENPNAVARFSTFGTFQYGNKSALKLFKTLGIELGARVSAKLIHYIKTKIRKGRKHVQEFELIIENKYYAFELVRIHEANYINVYARDITHRKLAESAAKDSEAKTRLIIDNALDAVITIDKEGIVTDWNNQAVNIFGWSRKEASGKKLSELIIPEEMREMHERGMKHYLRTGEGPVLNKRIEISAIKKDKELFPVELSVVPIHTGGDIQFSAFIRDITEQKRDKEVIKASEARYRLLVETASDLIYKADANGYCTYVNPLAARIMDCEDKELVGQHFSEFTRPDYVRKVTNHYEQQIKSKTKDTYLELPIVTKQGKELWIGQKVQMILEDGEIKGFTAFARDITDRVKAVGRLKASEEKYRGIIENMKLGLLEVDLKDEIKYANNAFSQMTGYSIEELSGKNATELLLVPKFTPKMKQESRERAKGKYSAYEVQIRMKDGSLKWLLISGAPLYDESGKVTGSIGIHLDITDRKKYETEIKKALKKEKELNELKSRFVSMTSHEFRTPLTTIQANLELLEFHLNNIDEELVSRLGKNFKRMSSEINRLTELMNDVLTLGRIDEGKVLYEPAYTDLEELCGEIIKQSFSNQPDGRTADFSIKGNKYDVYLDPRLFSHIIVNLLSNSFKYSKGAGNPGLQLNYNEDTIELAFTDQGIGIPKEERVSLFDSFYRAKNVDNIQGTGLGLSIVKQFLDMHEGQISVQSEQGKGSVFTIVLPKK